MPTNTIAENLELLQEAKEAIAEAITTAGGTVGSDDGLVHFAWDIGTIPSGNSNTTYYASSNYQDWIETFTVPDGITTIGSSVFATFSPHQLSTLKIPSSVTSIDYAAFAVLANLTTIYVDLPENTLPGAPWGATNATVTWTG